MDFSGVEDRFVSFSLIIPAHEEEGYIEKAVSALQGLEYPRKKLEVILVENGSQDRTHEIIEKTAPDWFNLLTCREPGVSKAKNKGIENISNPDGWVIFLDADAYFEKCFLQELNQYLQARQGKNLGCGMVSLRPCPDTRQARAWYRFYNFANRVTHTTRSIQIIRRDLLREFRFDEFLTFDEDTMLLRQCMTRARYFFVPTAGVFSSTRRFERNGWTRQLLQWVYFATRSYEAKKNIHYQVLR